MRIHIDDEWRIEDDPHCVKLIHEYQFQKPGKDKPSTHIETVYPGNVAQALELYARKVGNRGKAQSVQDAITELRAIEARIRDVAARVDATIRGNSRITPRDLVVPLVAPIEVDDF